MTVNRSQFKDKTYLVTGGAGFIGSHVSRALLKAGARVIVVDDFNDFYDPAIKEANIEDFEAYGEAFCLYREHIQDPYAMLAVFNRHGRALQTGGIIHLAARAGVRPSLQQPHLYVDTNVAGTMVLLDLARDFEIARFVFASSSSVYGDNPKTVPFCEEQDISKPISPYAATKAMGENMLHTYSHLYGTQVVALRFFTVYGAGQRPDLAIHKFTRLIDQGKPLPVYGDGSTRRDYTYIEDILEGVLAAIVYQHTNGLVPFEVFNLGESQTIELSKLITLIEQALGKPAIIHRQPMQPGDVRLTYADISKARALLGYNPTTSIEAGIPKFVDWYQQTYNSVPVKQLTRA